MSKIKKRILIVLSILVVLMIIAVGIGVVYFEGIAKKVVMTTLDGMGFEAGLDDLNIGIFGGTVELVNFSLKPKGGEPFLATQNVQANLSFFKALGGDILVEGFSLDGARINAQVDESGKIDLVAMAEDLSKDQEKESEPATKVKAGKGAFNINKIMFKDVKVTVQDKRPDAAIKQLVVSLGNMTADLADGKVSIEGFNLETPNKLPALSMKSMKTSGQLNPLSGEEIKVEEVQLSGLKGHNRMQKNGQFIFQQWAMDLAKANGLLTESTEESTTKEAAPIELPELVELNDVDYQLDYPGPGDSIQTEKIKLAHVMLKGKDLQVKGLAWNNELSPKPIVSVGSLDMEGKFLDTPPVLQDVQVGNLKVILTKKSGADFDLMQRVDDLTKALLPEQPGAKSNASEETPSPSIKGKVALNDVECHIITKLKDGVADDGIRVGSTVIDFSNGNLSVKQFALSDDKGSFVKPSISVDSIEGKTNLSYPLPNDLIIDQITVTSTDVNAVADMEGNVDLQTRMDRMMDRGPEEQTQDDSTETAQNIDLRKLETSDIHILVHHQLGENQSVPFEVANGELVVTDYVMPQAGNRTAAAKFNGDMVSPTTGRVEVDCSSPQANFAENLALKLLFELSDITALSPYYSDKMPFNIQSGRFVVTTDGKMENKNLDFPYTFKIQSPTLQAKSKETFNLFGNVTEMGAQTLVNGLKDKDGDLVYSGKVRGTMDKPDFSSPWASMANLFKDSMLSNVKNLSRNMLTNPIDTSAKIIGGTAKEVTEGAESLKEGAGKMTEKLKSMNPFAKDKE